MLKLLEFFFKKIEKEVFVIVLLKIVCFVLELIICIFLFFKEELKFKNSWFFLI